MWTEKACGIFRVSETPRMFFTCDRQDRPYVLANGKSAVSKHQRNFEIIQPDRCWWSRGGTLYFASVGGIAIAGSWYQRTTTPNG